jgi:DNA polymerase-3 subunit alpha
LKKGRRKRGVDGELAMKIFDLVEKFAGYGFNKSHSAAYALVSYQTLWLKAHYPAEFMAAVMTADMDNTEKVVGLVDECWRMGLKILPPDINSGLYHFHVNDDGEIVTVSAPSKASAKVRSKRSLKRVTTAVISASCSISARVPILKSSTAGCWKN